MTTEITYENIVQTLLDRGFVVIPKDTVRDYDRYLDQKEFRYIMWLDRIYQKIQRVPGHIVEVGVARGRNAIIFGHLIRMHGEDTVRGYYGFDTFDGYTEDDLRKSPHLSGDEWKGTTLEFVRGRIRTQDLFNICKVYRGDIRAEAKDFVFSDQDRFNPGKLKIALLYIDCNAYGAAKFSMDFFAEYMADGGVICIDEKTQGGETQALSEFCKENGLELTRDPGPFGIPAYTVFKS